MFWVEGFGVEGSGMELVFALLMGDDGKAVKPVVREIVVINANRDDIGNPR